MKYSEPDSYLNTHRSYRGGLGRDRVLLRQRSRDYATSVPDPTWMKTTDLTASAEGGLDVLTLEDYDCLLAKRKAKQQRNSIGQP